MRAYVIKNKDGKMLCWHHFHGYYFDHFNVRSLYYMEIRTKKEIKTVFNNKEFDNVDCTIVPITIAEGDLEKALDLACKELEARDEDKTHVRLLIQKIRNVYLGDNVGYKQYFIQQAKEEKEDERD